MLRYRYRIYPTVPQRQALARTFGCVRVVYNDAVAARRSAHAEGRPYPAGASLQRRLITEAKRTPERAWLTEVSNVPLQQAVRDCDRAYKNFFDSRDGRRAGPRIGPPRFKRRSTAQSARFTRQGFVLRASGRLYIAKIGDMRVAWSRALPSEPASVTVVKSPTGKYYASFVVELEARGMRLEPIADPGAETGIDLGLKDFAVLRGGKVIQNPRFFSKLERKLKRAQRVLSKKTPGSANRAKARLRLAEIHEKIRYSRTDWIDKQIDRIVAENQGIFAEDLNVAGLCRGRFAKSVQNAAFGAFLTRLESKAHRAGRTFALVDRFFPSTRLCSVCGALTGPTGLEALAVREWECPCGAVHDRDGNAEANIRREGKRLVAERHSDTENASGQRVRPGRPGSAGNPRKGRNEEPARGRTR